MKWDIANLCYAELYSGSSYDNGAMVQVGLSKTPVSGQLYFYGYAPSVSGAVVRVHVGNSYGVWTYDVLNTKLNTGGNNPIFVNCGYVTNIDKVAIVAFYPQGGSSSTVCIDAVFVMKT